MPERDDHDSDASPPAPMYGIIAESSDPSPNHVQAIESIGDTIESHSPDAFRSYTNSTSSPIAPPISGTAEIFQYLRAMERSGVLATVVVDLTRLRGSLALELSKLSTETHSTQFSKLLRIYLVTIDEILERCASVTASVSNIPAYSKALEANDTSSPSSNKDILSGRPSHPLDKDSETSGSDSAASAQSSIVNNHWSQGHGLVYGIDLGTT